MRVKKNRNIRLSSNVIPRRYKITLFPNLENFTFSGEEEIELSIKKSVKKIILHAAELQIDKASFAKNSKEIKAVKVSYDEETETADVIFAEKIYASGILKLSFTGILNDKMRGFYRSRYIHEGKDAPLNCPACKHPQAFYELLGENY